MHCTNIKTAADACQIGAAHIGKNVFMSDETLQPSYIPFVVAIRIVSTLSIRFLPTVTAGRPGGLVVNLES